MRLLPQSIAGRLLFWFFLCSATVMVAAEGILDQSVEKIVLASVDRTLHSKLQIITGLLHEEHGSVELELAEVIAGEYVIPRSGHYYRVLIGQTIIAASPSLVHDDFEFVPFGPSGNIGKQPAEVVYTSVGPDDEPVRVLFFQHAAFGKTFAITLAENLEEDLGIIATYQRFLRTVIPLCLLLLCFTAWWIAKVSLRPLATFSSTVETITHQNLTDQIDAGGTVQELTRLANSFNSMLDRLHAVFESQKRLVADASHELKTPVSVIRTQCDVVLQRPRTAEEYVDALETIRSSTEDIATLVRDLLSLARIEAGMVDPSDFATVSLKDCIDHVLRMTQSLAGGKGVLVTAKVDASTCVIGSWTGLVEAFLNVIENGIRYNREGGTVTISAVTQDGKVLITFADTGMGIAKNDLLKIFGRFYRAAAVRSTEGTGLGLSIVKSVVEAHRGTVMVESELGIGSRFIVMLPICCAATAT